MEFVNSSKSSNEYNDKGETTVVLREDWDTMDKIWVNNSMTKFEISSKNNKETERSFFIWQKASNKWRHTSRNLSEYDANNNISIYSIENYNIKTDTLIFSSKGFYEYFPNKNLKEFYYQIFDETIVDWVNVQRTKYTYNPSNSAVETLAESWSETLGAWQNTNKRTMVYDVNNLQTENKLEVWNATLGVYENYSLTLNKYGLKNLLSKTYSIKWDDFFNAWDSISKEEYFYNSKLKMDSSLSYFWSITGPWEVKFKTMYNYDSKESLIKELELNWISSLSKFENKNEALFEFNKDTFIVAEEYGYNWNADLEAYENHTRTEYSCPENENTGLLNLDNDLILVFPNPASNNIIHVSVSIPSLYKIYNIMGAIISIGSFEKGINSIEISMLPNGIYIIKTQTSSQKIIIE